MNRRGWVGSLLLLIVLTALGLGLGAWKYESIQAGHAASASQPEPTESVMVAEAKAVEHRPTTTSIGTVLALRSITVRNELPGTVHHVTLVPGQIVEAGTVLIALDVSVEEADLRAQEAQARLAKSVFARRHNLNQDQATTQEEVDRAGADLEVALAQIARTKAIIARKTIRAPFKAQVGIADVHPGQYLLEGTQLTTLQGIDDAVHVDFTVAQQVALTLQEGDPVDVFLANQSSPIVATILALDARIDPTTRNAMVRANIKGLARPPSPGASVRVQVPVGPPRKAIAVPVSALRKGPSGDQVFVIAPGKDGKTRAQVRQVESGAMLGDETVIHAGLASGELVATSGSFKLRDGVLVEIAGEQGGDAAHTRLLSSR
ncbi:MAG: efflux RND transporter periplasmic adaptor subunit [Nitrospirota bacterium]|nr:efflux RND transporter periplasmic adaptor subunit [Nitrospirota bacterium]MDP2382182.1 efflux RND transporter periplasmic adaptor subunit [Nitrospirota bacterium]MDP3595516.1 efflux RND transporter periplasmic adaptor subunit [Nitrospirota bacterium]